MIVVLNGATSAGKTSIAKAMQKLLKPIFLHVSLDSFLEMFPGDYDEINSKKERFDRRNMILSAMNVCIHSLASMGHHLIIDHVLDEPDVMLMLRNQLANFEIKVIGIYCPLPILEQRELTRLDRDAGLARGQFHNIHIDQNYDFELDSSQGSPEECAAKILDFMRTSGWALD
jgi:chloramphenicol 3-O phosphotransferase